VRAKKITLSLLSIAVLLSFGLTEVQAGPFGDGITFKRSKSKKFRSYVKIKKKDRVEKKEEVIQAKVQSEEQKQIAIQSPSEGNLVKSATVISEVESSQIEEKADVQYNNPRAEIFEDETTVSRYEAVYISYVDPLRKINIDKVSTPPMLSKKELRQLKRNVKKRAKTNKSVNASDAQTAAIVSYITPIGWLVSYLAMHSEGNSFSAFHLRQSLGLALISIIFGSISFYSAPLIGTVLFIGFFVFWLIGLLSAIGGTQKEIPLLGSLFQDWFSGIN